MAKSPRPDTTTTTSQVDATPAPTARKRKLGGRPRASSMYGDATISEILRRLSEGEALIKICRDPDMPSSSTVMKWVVEDYEGFAAKYARARDLGCDHMAEHTIEIADDSGLDVVMTDSGPKVDGEAVQRSKLRVDTRRWLLSKLAPKKYGDRIQVDGEITHTIQTMSDEDLMRRAREIAARLGIAPPDGSS